MQKVSVQSTYFSYVALSSSFKDIHVQAKVEEIFSWSLHAEKLIQPLQQFRKPFLWKFKEVAVASTILKLLIVAFRSVLDYNTALSDCRLVAGELQDDFVQQLSCSSFFLLPYSVSLVSEKLFLVCHLWRAARWAHGLLRMNQEHCHEQQVLSWATCWIYICQFSSSVKDSGSYVS